MHTLIKKLERAVVLGLCFFLPRERRHAVERWLRGREEARKLALADVVVVSFGKSGRTWLRVMLSRYYSQVAGLKEGSLIGFDNLKKRDGRVPAIFFTHDNYLKFYTGNLDSKKDFYGKRVVLLVRNPKDVAVSQYFQWKHRMRPSKKRLNQYPDHGAEVSPFEFVMTPTAGLDKVIRFMNLWADEAENIKDLLIVRYEDMRANTEGVFRDVVRFIDGQASDEHVRDAVEYSSVENMRKLEEKNVFWLSGGRMKPGKKGDPNSYKVRRAKVGGYRDYFTDEEVAQIDAIVRNDLSPTFGYEREAKPVATGDGAEAAAGLAAAGGAKLEAGAGVERGA